MPGVLVVIAFLAVLSASGDPRQHGRHTASRRAEPAAGARERGDGTLDTRGAVLLGAALAVLTGALSLLRLQPGSALGWVVLVAGASR